MSNQPKNNLLVRALSGAVYVGLVVSGALLGGWFLHILFGIFTALMLFEFAKMFQHSEYSPNAFFITLFGLIIYSLFILAIELRFESGVKMLIFSGVFLLFTLTTWFGVFEISSPTKHPIMNTALSVSAIIYIVPPMILVNSMAVDKSNNTVVFPLLGIFIMIWCADTFAFLIGKKLGKTPIAKSISPNKTWEGFLSGLIAAIVAGLLIAYILGEDEYIVYGLLAIVCAGFGLMGDLFESKIKRQLNLKDSGKIIPGHGGILDRFDSVLFVMPMAFLVVYLFKYLWP